MRRNFKAARYCAQRFIIFAEIIKANNPRLREIMADKTREQLRKFLELCVEQDVSAEGEDAISRWSEMVERDDNYFDVYRLTAEDKQQIKDLIAEYYEARAQENAEREKRRISEEKADEVMANHYADRIKKIVLAKPNKFFPKPKAAPRRKSH